MKIGMGIPETGSQATRSALAAWIERAEGLGYSYFTVSDHIVIPGAIESRYPYSESGGVSGWGECMEQFTYMAYLAAITTTTRLVSSVTVMPLRGAMHMAKTIATIDVLSGGRMVLGIGVGWLEEEFEAVQAPPFAARGRVTDEYLQAFKLLWTEDDPCFDGDHVKFANVIFEPKPVQKPHPPIWVGGESLPAMRRAVRHGDAWHPIDSNPRHRLDTLERMAAGIARLHQLAADQSRDPASIGVALYTGWSTTEDKADDGQRKFLTGSEATIAEDIQALEAMGVSDLLLGFRRDTLEESLDNMQYFADDIWALAR
jgi:probable F420-dependent oxidoreductase